jgi:hypothetical protein
VVEPATEGGRGRRGRVAKGLLQLRFSRPNTENTSRLLLFGGGGHAPLTVDKFRDSPPAPSPLRLVDLRPRDTRLPT